jgi:dienelactone hydrolase
MIRYLLSMILVLVILYGFTFTRHRILTSQIKGEEINYTAADGTVLKGYIAYNAASHKKRPAILVVPEWWGLTEYAKSRARQLAGLGYFAMAVDMYGKGKEAADPSEASKLATPFYQSLQLGKTRFDAAYDKIKTFKLVDTGKIAAIGYCFGGAIVLNVARMGEPLKAVVCFHGNLKGAPADKNLLKAKILVCQGGADKFVSMDEVAAFRKQMDSIGAEYTLKIYPNATHAFTNPASTATGKKFSLPIEYNPAADTASWNDMKIFFKETLK